MNIILLAQPRVPHGANRWRTFGHRAPPIVTETNLQISQLLGAGVGPPGALGEKSKHTDIDIVNLESDAKNHENLFSPFLKKRGPRHFGLS